MAPYSGPGQGAGPHYAADRVAGQPRLPHHYAGDALRATLKLPHSNVAKEADMPRITHDGKCKSCGSDVFTLPEEQDADQNVYCSKCNTLICPISELEAEHGKAAEEYLFRNLR